MVGPSERKICHMWKLKIQAVRHVMQQVLKEI